MEENNIQEQINQLNKKMDLLLEYVQKQNARTESVDDLVSDIAIIGKDFYDSSVEMLDNNAVEINPDEVKLLVLKFLRNIKNFNLLLETLESFSDLMKDAAPIANEVIIDLSKKLYEFETKGYFDFIKGFGKIADTLITNYSKEDMKNLSENIIVILDIVKNITDPKMLNFVNSTLKEFNNIKADKIKKYSLWQLMKEMKSPEMKQAMGFAVTLVKNISDRK